MANCRGWKKENGTPEPKQKDGKKKPKARKNNAMFDGLFLTCSRPIRPREEICVDYRYEG